MSGHSKWHSIRHKKAANDAKRGKVLTKHAKLIMVIAQNDPSPDTNAPLRTAISNAKSDGVPKDNIERILKKVAGGGNDGVIYHEVVYEGYGPNNIPFVVTALTDNIKRTFPEVRTAFMKNEGTLGTTGTVMFQFEHVGVIRFENEGKSEEDVLEILLEAEAANYSYEAETTEVITAFVDLAKVRDSLIEQGIDVKTAQPEYHAKDPQQIQTSADLELLESFIEKIEEVEDVSDVFAGFEPDQSLL